MKYLLLVLGVLSTFSFIDTPTPLAEGSAAHGSHCAIRPAPAPVVPKYAHHDMQRVCRVRVSTSITPAHVAKRALKIWQGQSASTRASKVSLSASVVALANNPQDDRRPAQAASDGIIQPTWPNFTRQKTYRDLLCHAPWKVDGCLAFKAVEQITSLDCGPASQAETSKIPSADLRRCLDGASPPAAGDRRRTKAAGRQRWFQV